MEKKRMDAPPLYLILSLILMVILHSLIPIAELFTSTGYKSFGIVLLFTGFGLIIWGANMFRIYQTPIKPFDRPTYLIQTGLFKYTRNPIYLGMVIVVTGAAFFLGSLSSFLVIPLFFYMMHRRFVVREEEYLEEVFGEHYREYKDRVRRWF